MAEEPYLYQELTAIEHLLFAGDMFCLPRAEMKARIAELLAGLDLEDKARARVATFSLGMKRKLAIALALMHRPSVLILDEPLNGLDPVMAELCRRQLLINDLTIEAVVKGDARLVRELIALDPMVSELSTARDLADEYLKPNARYLPTFR